MFIFIFVFQLFFDANDENQDESYYHYYTLDLELDSVKGFAIIIISFSFQQNLFPMYNSLKKQTNDNCLKACQIALGFTGFLYFSIALLGIFFFGSLVTENILNNVGNEEKNWESFALRIIYLLVLACHIPFIFFTGKESTLIIIDEIMRKSVSKALTEKIIAMGQSQDRPDQGLFVQGAQVDKPVSDGGSTQISDNVLSEDGDIYQQ